MNNSEILLLEEFKRLHDLYMQSRLKRNERVNFFVGLSTAIGSGLVILSQTKILSVNLLQWFASLSLIWLGVLGIVVYRDMVRSEINSAVYLKSIDLIKYYFTKQDKILKRYLVFPSIVDGASSFMSKKHFWLSTNPLFVQALTSLLWGGAISFIFLRILPNISR